MRNNSDNKRLNAGPNNSSSSLLPMLISGLVLIIIGMIAVVALA